MWMENGKKNKIKEQFKAEMSTRDHTLLPGSPAVHLVSLCLICGHLWCALSRSSHLVHLLRVQTTICAPFLLTQGARPLALPAAGGAAERQHRKAHRRGRGEVPKSEQSGSRQNPNLSYEKQNDCEDRQILRPRIVYVYRVPCTLPR